MNCRDTIDHLLFNEETEFTDSQLESHLEQCARCRSLVEVISPMLDAKPSSNSLSSSRSIEKLFNSTEVTPASQTAIETAETSAQRLSTTPLSARVKSQHNREERSQNSLNKMKLAAAFLAGVAASFGGIAALRSESVSPSATANTTCLYEVEQDSEKSSESIVRSCMACHLASK